MCRDNSACRNIFYLINLFFEFNFASCCFACKPSWHARNHWLIGDEARLCFRFIFGILSDLTFKLQSVSYMNVIMNVYFANRMHFYINLCSFTHKSRQIQCCNSEDVKLGALRSSHFKFSLINFRGNHSVHFHKLMFSVIGQYFRYFNQFL